MSVTWLDSKVNTKFKLIYSDVSIYIKDYRLCYRIQNISHCAISNQVFLHVKANESVNLLAKRDSAEIVTEISY